MSIGQRIFNWIGYSETGFQANQQDPHPGSHRPIRKASLSTSDIDSSGSSSSQSTLFMTPHSSPRINTGAITTVADHPATGFTLSSAGTASGRAPQYEEEPEPVERTLVSLRELYDISISQLALEVASVPSVGSMIEILERVFRAIGKLEVNKEQWKLLQARCVMVIRLVCAQIVQHDRHHPWFENAVRTLEETLERIDQRAQYYNNMNKLEACARFQAISNEIKQLFGELDACLNLFSYTSDTTGSQWVDELGAAQQQELIELPRIMNQLLSGLDGEGRGTANGFLQPVERFNQRLVKNSDVIQNPMGDKNRAIDKIQSEAMSTREMFECLLRHGCYDLTGSINLEAISPFPVATGGCGDVWKGKMRDNTDIAIKVWRFRPQDADSNQSLKGAMRELYYWSRTDHENVHKLLGVIMFQGRLGMISEWMEHGDLREYMRRNQTVDKYQLCLQAAKSVQYLHSKGMVHGDLKARNFLVSSDGLVKLADFDHSIVSNCSLAFSEKADRGGGTLRWMAPELVLLELPHRRCQQTDIYALGMTMLEIITEAMPYSDLGDMFIATALSRKILPTQTEHFQTSRGEQMWLILVRCWDHEPAARPTANEVLNMVKMLQSIAGRAPNAGHSPPHQPPPPGDDDDNNYDNPPPPPRGTDNPFLRTEMASACSPPVALPVYTHSKNQLVEQPIMDSPFHRTSTSTLGADTTTGCSTPTAPTGPQPSPPDPSSMTLQTVDRTPKFRQAVRWLLPRAPSSVHSDYDFSNPSSRGTSLSFLRSGPYSPYSRSQMRTSKHSGSLRTDMTLSDVSSPRNSLAVPPISTSETESGCVDPTFLRSRSPNVANQILENEQQALVSLGTQCSLSLAQVVDEIAPVPGIGALMGSLTLVFQAVEHARVNKEQWKLLQGRCVMVVRIAGAQVTNYGQHHYPELETATNELREISERVRRYNEMNEIIAFLQYQAISDEIRVCFSELDSCLSFFSYASNIAQSQWVGEFRAVQQRELSELSRVHGLLSTTNTNLESITHNQDQLLALVDTLKQELVAKSEVLENQNVSVQSYIDAQHIVRTILAVTKLRLPPKLLLGKQCILDANVPIKTGITCDIYAASFLGGEKVAKKVFRIGMSDHDFVKQYAERFLRIASLWSEFRSDHTLPFYGIGVESFEGDRHFQLYMVSPLMKNYDAMTYLKQYRNNAGMKQGILRIITDAARGLQYLHTRNPPVVHSGMRGDNILITESGGAILGGFGLTKALETEGNNKIPPAVITGKTESQRWMAPELFVDDSPRLQTPSDVWGWAMAALEIVSGSIPYFTHTQTLTMMLKVRKGPPRRKDHVKFDDYAHRPDELWELFEGCWAYEPSERPTMDYVVMKLNEMAKMPESVKS